MCGPVVEVVTGGAGRAAPSRFIDGRSETYTVTDPRPMLKLITMLEEKYGWRITYEDPPYEHPDDLVDVTHPTVGAQAPQARTLIPRGGTFTLHITTPPGRDPDRRDYLDRSCRRTARTVLVAASESSTRGSFSHVVAGEVKKRDGTTVTRGSVLDARISFPSQDRTLGDALALILKLAGDQTGTRITFGYVPANLLNHHVGMGAANIEARDALFLAFASVDAEAIGYGLLRIRVTWALLYQADQETYYFNAHGVSAQPLISPFHKKKARVTFYDRGQNLKALGTGVPTPCLDNLLVRRRSRHVESHLMEENPANLQGTFPGSRK